MNEDKILSHDSKRCSYLSVTQFRTLEDWCLLVADMFGRNPYLVGSTATSPDWRDVDIRLPLADADYEQIDTLLSMQRLGHIVSIWGQQVTGLPIDFQLQRHSEFVTYKAPSNPMGIRDKLSPTVQQVPEANHE